MKMIIHFVCRGNSFRSIIAEAYLNSLQFKNLKAMSSGTTAAADRAGNLAGYTATLRLLAQNGIQEFAKAGYGDQLTQSRVDEADVIICMNKRVHDECQRLVTLPESTRIWSVADIGERGRIAHTESDKTRCRQEAYQEIVEGISQLMPEIPQKMSAAQGPDGQKAHIVAAWCGSEHGLLRGGAHLFGCPAR